MPDQMATPGKENMWWRDVLENGPVSRYAVYFAVDWHPPEVKLRHTVPLSVLGDHYGRILEAGGFRFERTQGTFTIRYYDPVFPVALLSREGKIA